MPEIILGNEAKSIVTTNKKFSNDYKEAKNIFEYYASNRRGAEEIDRIMENLDLHQGRWHRMESFENNGLSSIIDDEAVEIGKVKIQHYPIVNKVTQSMVATLIRLGLSYNIKDNSAKANNLRKERRLQVLFQKLQEKYINPIQEAVTQQVMLEQGIQPNVPMDNQQMQQINEVINQRMKQMTPESIQNALKSIQTPDEFLASKLLETAILENKASQQFNIGGVYAVTVGEEYYRVSLIDGRLHFEALNVKNLVWGGSEHVTNIEDGLYAVYRQPLTPEDVIQRYGTLLSKKTVQELYNLFSPLEGDRKDGSKKTYLEFQADELLPYYKLAPELFGDIDPQTKEGQARMWAVRNALLAGQRMGGQIIETYVTWRWIREMKLVERIEDGVKERYFFDEHYEKQPNDISVTPFYAEEVWEGVSLGENDNREYVYLRPVPYQYPDMKNPRKPKLTIFGGLYNTVHNNTKVTVPLDLAKPYQYNYNYIMAKMKEEEATEIGKVFTMTMRAKPDNWSWPQWVDVLRKDRMLMMSQSYEGVNPSDLAAFKTLDLSTQDRFLSYLQRLDKAEQSIYAVMNSNPAAMGNQNPYATDQNLQISLQGAENLMLSFYDRNREIKENVLNGLLNAAMIAYKYHGYQKDIILDEFSKQYFEMQEPFQACALQLYVISDNEERQKLKEMQQLALTFLQNSGDHVAIARIYSAKSIQEVEVILDESRRRTEEQQQAQLQAQQQQLQMQLQAQEKAAKDKLDLEKYKIDTEAKVRIEVAKLTSQQMLWANDVNQDKVNDATERTLIELNAKMELEREKLQVEREKIAAK